MARRSSADLPLHSGSAPRWLFDRMEELGGAIAAAVVDEHGPAELVARLADPYWFQALGCALGFDWHSSGLTTTTMGALKEAIDPEELGVAIVGGKGGTSRQTPDEIHDLPLGLGGGTRDDLERTSRLSAAVDNGCVQDGFTLYHHTMAVTEDGEWCVVQQGMDESHARRYHWLADGVDSFVAEPQNAICSQSAAAAPLDLTAARSAENRSASVDLVNDDPAHLRRELSGQHSLADFGGGQSESSGIGEQMSTGPADYTLPDHHQLSRADLSERALERLDRAYEYGPEDYEELVALDGIGPASLRALALVAELVYDAETAREDPASHAYAHGGKDGTPHPVDRERYDRSIEYLQSMLEGSETERETKQAALQRLADARGQA
ncbi:MAG: DUF763 domain-containing protein [Salinirussus sp.]